MLRILLLLLSFVSLQTHGGTEPLPGTEEDHTQTTEAIVDLWFFWSKQCPHCTEAHPHIDAIKKELPWLRVLSLRVDGRPKNIAIYRQMAREAGETARSVPAFIFCGRMIVGWDKGGVIKQQIYDGLSSCKSGRNRTDGLSPQVVVLPVLGEIDPGAWSLPAITVVIAALDSFNPCAFFVLLFLLSLLVHAGSRPRMFAVGGLYVLISGVVYFAAMAAWMNIFTLVGHLPMVTLLAGVVTITISLINIKDYFWFKKGASLSITQGNRRRLVQRMKGLVSSSSLAAMLLATFSLAFAANLYELLCTAGFPMVYTRLLTLSNLSDTEYYTYLLLYNVVYVLPLLLIMVVFVATLGQRKLQEREGRLLKLLSGIMMLGLGTMLIVAPAALNQVWVAAALLPGAITLTWMVNRLFPVP